MTYEKKEKISDMILPESLILVCQEVIRVRGWTKRLTGTSISYRH